MEDPVLATQPIADLLDLLIRSMGLDLQYKLLSSEGATPEVTVQLSGLDAGLLTARHGELLHAIEHVAAKILHLEPEEHHRISFDADSFKVERDRELRAAAERAIAQVRETGAPFAFPPMTSRERRMLHLELEGCGLPTASSGENPRRFVVLYPAASTDTLPKSPPPEGLHQLRSAFRPR